MGANRSGVEAELLAYAAAQGGGDHEDLARCVRELIAPAAERLGGIGETEPLGLPGLVPDATTKILVRNRDGRPAAVFICSAAAAPGMVARGVSRAVACAEQIGSELGAAILLPLLQGEWRGRSWSLLPWYQPLARTRMGRALEKRRVVPGVLDWLRGAVGASCAWHRRNATTTDFRTPLINLEAQKDIAPEIRGACRAALERLSAGVWTPAHVLDHNDLWWGNVLMGEVENGTRRRKSVIIDWGASNPRGFGIYDLVRASISFDIGRKSLRREVELHCEAMGCTPTDARGHLAAALGWLEMNLERFQRSRYLMVVQRCWHQLLEAE